MSPVTSSRRDRKKLTTRRALRWAALELVAARGYAHVTVEDIAEAADVSTRTFFNYFASKEAVVIGQDAELLEEIHAALLARPVDESPFAAVRAVVIEQVGRFERDGDGDDPTGEPAEWFRRMKAVLSDPQLRGAHAAHMADYERVIQSAVAERLGTDPERDPYPALLAASAVAAARVGIMYWAKSGGTGSPGEITAAALDALAAGLGDGGDLAVLVARPRGKAQHQ